MSFLKNFQLQKLDITKACEETPSARLGDEIIEVTAISTNTLTLDSIDGTNPINADDCTIRRVYNYDYVPDNMLTCLISSSSSTGFELNPGDTCDQTYSTCLQLKTEGSGCQGSTIYDTSKNDDMKSKNNKKKKR